MRFGRTLAEELVPEWRDQYLDYFGGKKLIKKLSKNKSAASARLKGALGSRRARGEANEEPPSYGSFQLPSPLIHPEHPPPKSLQSKGFSSSREDELSEISPLTQSSHSFQQFNPDQESPKSRRFKHEKEAEFSGWLEQEIAKIGDFYVSQETEAKFKMALLKSQVELLLQHKQEYKKQKKAPRVKVFERFQMPSLPGLVKELIYPNESSEAMSPQTTYGSRSDFKRQPHNYVQSKAMIKTAMLEFYHSLQALKGYRGLNTTAVKKVAKKFDKTLHTNVSDKFAQKMSKQAISESPTLDNLTRETENLFAQTFLDGNHKKAVEHLQAITHGRSYNREVLTTGVLLGAGLPLFVTAAISGINDLLYGDTFFETRMLLQIWAGFFFISYMLLLFSLNILVWHAFRVNYVFVFDLSRYTALDYRQYSFLPSLYFFGTSLFAWLTFCTESMKFPERYYPCIFLGVSVFIFILPIPVLFHKTRSWTVHGLLRLVMSGLYPVEFRDFFLGDIFCSLTYTLSNLSLFFCLYTTSNWWQGGPRASRCTSSHSPLMGFLNSLPGIWRLLQCWRRYGDTRNWFPHLLNSGKYACQILYTVFLSLARINPGHPVFKVLFLAFACINSIYASLWDVLMDFSLGPNLREELAFPRWSYILVMIVDPVLRFSWVLYAIDLNMIGQSAWISFVVALIEVTRRFIWVFFRVENEHCENVNHFRASKDLDLPYMSSLTQELSEITPGDTSVASETPGTFRSMLASPRIQSFGYTLRKAHTMDFERRRPHEVDDDEEEEDDDDA